MMSTEEREAQSLSEMTKKLKFQDQQKVKMMQERGAIPNGLVNADPAIAWQINIEGKKAPNGEQFVIIRSETCVGSHNIAMSPEYAKTLGENLIRIATEMTSGLVIPG